MISTTPLPQRPRYVCVFKWLLLLACFTSTDQAIGQLSKGHRILIEKGLQVQGLCIDDNFVTLSTYTNANYSSFCWLNEYSVGGGGEIQATHSSRPDWMGAAPGALPWSRWVRHETLMPPHVTPYGGDETPFLSQLMALQLGDEWNLNDDTVRDRLVNWFAAERTNWPNTILYHNSWGSQIADGPLNDFYTRAQPDMLSFDTYPWRSVWDANQPNHIGTPIGGPPTGWYGDLRRYREHGRAAGIPVGIYRQTFHSVQDYDNTVYRDPSLSELRLNTFAALAFNVKFFMDYTYNTGANSMFERQCNWCGDTAIKTNGVYAELSDVNLRARNLGKALVRLTPITSERIPGYTTSMMIIRGKDGNGAYTPVPVGFLTGGTEAHTSWMQGHNDPYLKSWAVLNPGTVNNGQPGDVIVSWFKPLDESFDGPDHAGEIYMMVVNGLTHTNGTAAECAQTITLNFDSRIGALEMVNAASGLVEVQPLPLINDTRQLVLSLQGGDGVLFKFATGAPFVGVEKAGVSGAPLITLHPGGRQNVRGTHATFRVSATGSATLAYQWRLNGENIPGATDASYIRSNVQFADAGNYSVIVSNGQGSATSSAAELTVVSGVPFFYEPFDYPNVGAPVSSNSPGNWVSGGAGTNDLNVAPGSLSYPGLVTSLGNSVTNGGVGLGIRRLLGTNVSGGALYVSALFRMNDMGTSWVNAGNPVQVGALGATNDTFRLQVMVRSNTPSTYLVGVQKVGGAGIVTHSTPRNVGETIFVVGKYDFTVSPHAVTLWVNPPVSSFASDAEPPDSVSSSSGTDAVSTMDRFNFRQNTAQSVPAAMQWDELRVGSSWADVTPLASPVPVLLTNIARIAEGAFQFSFSAGMAQQANVYGSTNLSHWTLLGSPVEVSPGIYQFSDGSATNELKRFYQLRWP